MAISGTLGLCGRGLESPQLMRISLGGRNEGRMTPSWRISC
jgi:hypothetical protein